MTIFSLTFLEICTGFTVGYSAKFRTKTIQLKPNSFVAKIDTSLGQDIFDLAKTKRVTHVNITAKQMISGLELKYLNGLGDVIC